MNVTLVYTVNATGACTPTQMAADLLAAWDDFDLSVLTTVYLGCTVSSVTTAETSTQASITIVITLSAAFLAAFPAVASGEDPSPFLELFTAQFRAAVVQPVMASTPTYQLSANLAIAINPTETNFGQGTAATATVTGTGPVPTGTVQFAVQGVGNVGAPQNLVAGTVTFNIPGNSFPNPGTWEISYTYSGDAHYASGVSPNAPFKVDPS